MRQYLLDDVPADRLTELERAVTRVNHHLEVPGFGLDHLRRRVYFKLAAPVFAGIDTDTLNRLAKGALAMPQGVRGQFSRPSRTGARAPTSPRSTRTTRSHAMRTSSPKAVELLPIGGGEGGGASGDVEMSITRRGSHVVLKPPPRPCPTPRSTPAPSSRAPFSAPVNSLLSASFDSSLDDISVQRGAGEANRAWNARAYTMGTTIALGDDIREDVNDASSMGGDRPRGRPRARRRRIG